MFINADHDITERIGEIVADQTADLTQQIALVSEKVGLHGRNQELMRAAVERTTDYRSIGLAQLVRSDSEALQRLIQERTGNVGGEVREAVAEAISEKMEGVERSVERMTAAVGAMDGMDSALAESQSAVAERLMSTVGESQERLAAQLATAQEQFVARMVDAQATVQERVLAHVDETQGSLEERMRTHLDDRMTAIAKLIRSDNQVLVERFAASTADAPTASGEPVADAELMRQVLRAVKELEAGLASDMLGTMDRRFQTVADQLHKETQSTAEAMLKIAEILGEKIDRLTVRVDEGVGGEMQVVVDRMSDAIQALSSSQRRQSA